MRNKYPLPLIEAVFSPLTRLKSSPSSIYGTFITLSRSVGGGKWKRALNPSLGYFECLVMRLESTSAPAVFQALVNNVLQDMLNRFLFVYIDDILILSETLEEHIQHF